MNRKKIMSLAVVLFASIAMALTGCSSGSSSSSTQAPATPRPLLEVIPATFDFGTVTDGNLSDLAPLLVTLNNNGSANLNISSFTLSDPVNFTLDTANGGTNPCVSNSPTIPAGESCTVAVVFSPTIIDNPYTAGLTIVSNDTNSPFTISLAGALEAVATLNVKINQIEACPRPNATAYVSVTDQGGFPVTGLGRSNFTLSENGVPLGNPAGANLVADDVPTISVALLLDYSGSITNSPTDVEDMENAAINFVNQMGANDEAELIKFAAAYDVTQPFTSSKADLIAAIRSATDLGRNTLLYDTVVKAVDDIKTRVKDRKAIILFTDGVDYASPTQPLSTNSLEDAVAYANAEGIPVFAVGLGQEIDPDVLRQLADETGGTFYEAATSSNLATIYQQLATLLFTDQYILTFISGLGEDETGDLTVTAAFSGLEGSDTKLIPACP